MEISATEIKKLIERLISGPFDPEKEFVYSGHTYSDVYNIAAGILQLFDVSEDEGPVCICTESKGVIAAALIASLAGGPVFVFPYAFSLQVIKELHEAIGTKKVLTDRQIELPDGVEAIIPKPGIWDASLVKNPKEIDSVFLQLFTGGSTGKPKVWSKTVFNVFSEADFLSGQIWFIKR